MTGVPARVVVDLDPAAPALDHHRAGGLPLFGTSMGIGAMSRAAVAADPLLARIEAVGVYEPYILDGDGPHRIAVCLDAPDVDADGGFVAARVVRAAPGLAAMTLFDARFRVAAAAAGGAAVPPGDGDGGVVLAEVYRVFFPGPAFQVIAAARLMGARLVSRLSAGPVLVPVQSRLIEFAMQSAGLLELATSGRRMIPHRIGWISPIVDAATVLPAVVYATAAYGADNKVISVNLTDGQGVIVMTLGAYETVALPFPADPAVAAVMTGRLRATQG